MVEHLTESEIVAFSLGCLAAALSVWFSGRKPSPIPRFFKSGFFFLVLSYGFSILEHFYLHPLTSFLENLFEAFAGICFLAGVVALGRRGQKPAGREGKA